MPFRIIVGMRMNIARVKGLAYILWHGKHMLFHVLWGLMWAWFLREHWHEFNPKLIWTAVIGSILPDADHFLYFFTYGKHDPYTRAVASLFRNRQWRMLTRFISQGHKHNTKLTFHNYYMIGICAAIGILASAIDWQAGVVLFGAMVSHFLFDITEDMLLLGRINPNWARWGRGRLS